MAMPKVYTNPRTGSLFVVFDDGDAGILYVRQNGETDNVSEVPAHAVELVLADPDNPVVRDGWL